MLKKVQTTKSNVVFKMSFRFPTVKAASFGQNPIIYLPIQHMHRSHNSVIACNDNDKLNDLFRHKNLSEIPITIRIGRNFCRVSSTCKKTCYMTAYLAKRL